MKIKRVLGIALFCVIAFSCFSFGADAVALASPTENIIIPMATGSFNTDIPAHKSFKSNSTLPLEAGESVTIKASYSPYSASVDFGLVSSDGKFYSINCTSGSFDKTIIVTTRGNYSLGIRNNSDIIISVSGYVNY